MWYNSPMFDKFRQGAEMIKAAQKMRQVQNELGKQRISYEEDGIRVVVSGDLKIKELSVDGSEQNKVAGVINKAFGKAQKEVAKKMQEMGGIGSILSGLGG